MARVLNLFLFSLLGLSLLANAVGYFAALQARKAGLERQRLSEGVEMRIFMLTVENAVLRSKANGCGEFFRLRQGTRQRS